MSAPAPRYQRLERDERREQILVCARRLFSEGTYSGVSTADIAREAGVARGLLHHYFGTKRELYLEVVRELLAVPSAPPVIDLEGRDPEEVLGESVDRWLDLIKRNRGTWLAAIGADGFGRDPELERIVEASREAMADRLLLAIGIDGDEARRAELRAVIRTYGGMAEAATREWLDRRRLSREQVHILLTDTLQAMVRDMLPRIVDASTTRSTA